MCGSERKPEWSPPKDDTDRLTLSQGPGVCHLLAVLADSGFRRYIALGW